jgi:hypothetical protein
MLPTAKAPEEPGFLGPSYDFADNLKIPKQVGVNRGDSLASVIDAVKGAAYYTDMIGFGEASNQFTRSMGEKPTPLGVNYFIKTGLRCSNGADMYYYVQGIPKGDALGRRVQYALRESGLPQLRGLAPGILEDAKDALNPIPVINAVLGSGYAKCRKVTLPVGDPKGSIQNPDIPPLNPGEKWQKGEKYILGPIQYINGFPHQTRWVQDIDDKGKPIYLTQTDYNSAPKDFCPDGSAKSEHISTDCSKPLKSGIKEKFVNQYTTSDILLPLILTGTAIGLITYLKH